MDKKINTDNIKDLSLSEIINYSKEAAKFMESYKIQYYYNPNLLLKEVLEEKEIEKFISALEETINNNKDKKNISKKNLIELSEYIVLVHHTYVRKTLQEIAGEKRNLKVKQPSEIMDEVDRLLKLLSKDMIMHMEKEERILFPLIKYLVDTDKFHEKPKTRNYGTVINPIRQMLFEHKTALEIISRINDLLNIIISVETNKEELHQFILLINEFESDLHLHIHLENNILFPKTIELETKLLHN